MAGPGKRHSARGAPHAQPRDVRSAGRDTWNLTGEASAAPENNHGDGAPARDRGAARPSGALTQVPKDCHAPKIRSKKVAEVPFVVFTRKTNILAQFKKNLIITFSANAPHSGGSSHTQAQPQGPRGVRSMPSRGLSSPS